MRVLALALLLILRAGTLSAQEEHTVWNCLPDGPVVEGFKENFFVTGIPLNAAPDYDTNDLSFQVSLKFNMLQFPDSWKVFWGYSQLSIWEIYKPSNPFKGNTYADGLYVYHTSKDGRREFLGGYEHRSNGLDSHASRSLDYGFISFTRRFSDCFTGQITGRFGIGSIGNDFSLEMFNRYEGYLNMACCFNSRDRRFLASLSATPLFGGGDIPANVSAELAFRPTRNVDWFYLTARYHFGYDEEQGDCANPDVFLKHMLRFGLSVQPSRMSHKLFF